MTSVTTLIRKCLVIKLQIKNYNSIEFKHKGTGGKLPVEFQSLSAEIIIDLPVFYNQVSVYQCMNYL